MAIAGAERAKLESCAETLEISRWRLRI